MNMKTTDKVQVGNSTTGTSTSTTASQWQTYNHYTAERGWECPRCGRINAPWVRQCDCPNNNNWTITTDWTYKPEWWKEVTCQGTKTVPDSNVYQTGGSDYKAGDTYVNVSGTQSNKAEPNVTAWSSTSPQIQLDSNTFRIHPDSTIYSRGNDYKVEDTCANVGGTQSNKTNPNVTAWSCTTPDIAINDFTTYRTDIPKTYTTTNNDLEPLTRHFKD